MSDPRNIYDEQVNHCRETAHLQAALGLAGWDQQTMLPPKGRPMRAKQIAALTSVLHARETDPAVGERLDALEGSPLADDPASPEAVNIREWRRDYDQAVKIPHELAVALAEAASEGHAVWERARAEDDFPLFAPMLDKLVDLAKQKAEALGYEREPYDALLDAFEPGETAAAIEPLFEELRDAIIPLVAAIGQADPAPPLPTSFFSEDDQKAFLNDMLRAFGFDFEAGRLDTAAHPFSQRIAPGDVRITVRYETNDFTNAFYSAAHECGHALYSLGLLDEHFGTPMGRSVSLGIHESQSRLWENLVGRSRAFWTFALPTACGRFPKLAAPAPETLYRIVNAVRPSLIRVDADELTYNLHVMVRFELEKALFRGELETGDIPDAWNEKMRAFLGITPTSPAVGALQDVHWSMGYFGYFPTYALGNMYAAQFMAAARRALPRLDVEIERGDFTPLLAWLRERIHAEGRRLLPRDLVRNVTGQDLSPSFLIDYFKDKYGELYGIETH